MSLIYRRGLYAKLESSQLFPNLNGSQASRNKTKWAQQCDLHSRNNKDGGFTINRTAVKFYVGIYKNSREICIYDKFSWSTNEKTWYLEVKKQHNSKIVLLKCNKNRSKSVVFKINVFLSLFVYTGVPSKKLKLL